MPSFSFFQSTLMSSLIGAVGMNMRFNGKLNVRCFYSNFTSLPKTTWFLCCKQNNQLNLVSDRQMAGHSKWQNVKHIKAEKDRQKNLLCNKYVYLIGIAVREGGPDPKLNIKLSNILEQAKKNNVPSSTVENALKRGGNKKNKYGSAEILSPGGCIVIVEYETDNISTIRHEIKSVCKKHGANVLSGEGRWRAVYEQKGIIKAIQRKDGEQVDAEKALDDAIEAGAEEVSVKDDEAKPYLEFLCAPEDLNTVKKEIEQLYEVEEGYLGYLPTVTIQLDEETNTIVDNLLEDLGNISDIVRIYENVQ